MSKKVKHYKLKATLAKKSLRKRKMNKEKTRRRKFKAGNGENVICSMCEKQFPINNTLIPRECLMKNGKAAHRICQNCWWDPETGFALDSSSHKCPGCQKGLPLTSYKKVPPIFVDLTEE